MMKETTLIFKSLTELWDFKLTTHVPEVEINTDKKSLRGNFTTSEVELALQSFHAWLPEGDGAVKKA